MKEQIRKFISETFLYGEPAPRDDAPLFDSGLIDSLGFIKLLAFIEKTFGVAMDMSEVGIENFNTIDAIARTIESKRAGA